MKIAIIQDQLRGGGTEKHTLLFADFFRREGHEVKVICFRPGGALASRLQPPAVVLQRWDTRLNFFAPGLLSTLEAFGPEAVLCMGWEANRRIPGIKRLLPQARVVATQRTGKGLTRLALRALRAADGVMANSRWARDRAVAAGVEPERCLVVNNALGFQVSDDPVARTRIRQELGANQDDVVLVNVAGFRRGKGQAELLAILEPLFRTNPGLRLWLVGEGPERKRCEQLAAVLEVKNQVVFTGRREDVMAILTASDICVHASQRESQPNALIEAQACGLPVAAWSWAGVEETFLHGESGLAVSYGDVSGLRTAVQKLVEDEGLRKAMGTLGKRFARETFDTEKNARACLAFLGHFL